ncbi:MAG: hypothetical protein J7M08_08425 [Planctomycetes bacterium]|nr:hypothetical protein [Planctomycetota bacterium]
MIEDIRGKRFLDGTMIQVEGASAGATPQSGSGPGPQSGSGATQQGASGP